MVPPPRDQAAPGNDYGTMLEIRNVQMLADGRSIVETWGTWRFRIMERGVLDGYVVGRVERIDDFGDDVEEGGSAAEGGAGAGSSSVVEPEPEAQAEAEGTRTAKTPTNEELMALCRDFLEELKEGTPWVGQQLTDNYVPMPEDAARFSFWIALVSRTYTFEATRANERILKIQWDSSCRSQNTKKRNSSRSARRASGCGLSSTGSNSSVQTGTSSFLSFPSPSPLPFSPPLLPSPSPLHPIPTLPSLP